MLFFNKTFQRASLDFMSPLVARKAKPPLRRQQRCAAPFLTVSLVSLCCVLSLFCLRLQGWPMNRQFRKGSLIFLFFFFTFLTTLSMDLGASFTLSKGGAAFLSLCSQTAWMGCTCPPACVTHLGHCNPTRSRSCLATAAFSFQQLYIWPCDFFLYLFAIFFCLCFY